MFSYTEHGNPARFELSFGLVISGPDGSDKTITAIEDSAGSVALRIILRGTNYATPGALAVWSAKDASIRYSTPGALTPGVRYRIGLYAEAGASATDGKFRLVVHPLDSDTPTHDSGVITGNTSAGVPFGRIRMGKWDTSALAISYWMDDRRTLTDADAKQEFLRFTPAAAATVGTISMLDQNWTITGSAPNRVAAVTDNADSTGLTSPGAATNETTQGRLGVPSAGNLTLTAKLSRPSGSSATSARVELLQGATVVASGTATGLTSTPTTTTVALTSTQNAAVTDRERLSWRIVGNPA